MVTEVKRKLRGWGVEVHIETQDDNVDGMDEAG